MTKRPYRLFHKQSKRSDEFAARRALKSISIYWSHFTDETNKAREGERLAHIITEEELDSQHSPGPLGTLHSIQYTKYQANFVFRHCGVYLNTS